MDAFIQAATDMGIPLNADYNGVIQEESVTCNALQKDVFVTVRQSHF